MVLSLVSLSNESCLLLPRILIDWQGFPLLYWKPLCLLPETGTDDCVSTGTHSLLPGESDLGSARCLRTSWVQNFYGQLCSEKSSSVSQEAVWKKCYRINSRLSYCKTLKAFFFSYSQKHYHCLGQSICSGKKQTNKQCVCFVSDQSTSFFSGAFSTSFTCQITL